MVILKKPIPGLSLRRGVRLHEQLQNIDRERGNLRPDERPAPERNDLERQVQELRMQVNGVNEQMGELRELLNRLLEENGQRERR